MLKQRIQSGIRRVHVIAAPADLPAKLAICLHAVETSTELRDLDGALRRISEAGYRFCTPEQYANSEGRCALITFDDNFRSWLDVLPILSERRVTATFYVNTMPLRDIAEAYEIDHYYDRIAHSGTRLPLSSDELNRISDFGHTIGSHGHAHLDLGSIPYAAAVGDIHRSKQLLGEMLGLDITDFAFPFGFRRNFSKDLREACLSMGFRTVAHATPGLLVSRPSPHELMRNSWRFDRTPDANFDDLRVNGSLFTLITGRSAVG